MCEVVHYQGRAQAAEAQLAAIDALVVRWRAEARDNQFYDFRADELEAVRRGETP